MSQSRYASHRYQRSPLIRRIVLSNVIALFALLIGIMYFLSSTKWEKESWARFLAHEAALYTVTDGEQGVPELLLPGVERRIFDESGAAISPCVCSRVVIPARKTPVVDALGWIWSFLSPPADPDALSETAITKRLGEEVVQIAQQQGDDNTTPTAGTLISLQNPTTSADEILALVTAQASGDELRYVVHSTSPGALSVEAKWQREIMLRLFLLAVFLAIGLSYVLAQSISKPIRALAEAARPDGALPESRGTRFGAEDMTSRQDEIGYLSRSMLEMTAALFDRIEATEHFAADVAHEIKNPLASLNSAVDTLRNVHDEEARAKLQDLIEHDVRRLDRLVTEISNASRLDAELVKEEMLPFDLTAMVETIASFHKDQAEALGVTLTLDRPREPIIYNGLEARLAQVIVNLLSNAISFCTQDDTVRIWLRQREERLLIVVEDTGPGIPEEVIDRIFKRFYSHRPQMSFGNFSGLGLSICKQIVEAHGGVIWAENITDPNAKRAAAPLGARFVVALPD